MERALGPGSLLNNIQPPRLEDAGLEDCALPPESIKEAFLKAAAAAGSRAASIFGTSADESDEEGSCLNDPNPNNKQPSDVLVGISGVDPPPAACGGNKGGGVPEVRGDDLAAGMSDAKGMTDKVVDGGVLPTGGGEGCVDGLKGLDIGEKGSQVEEEDEEREVEIPILAEALV